MVIQILKRMFTSQNMRELFGEFLDSMPAVIGGPGLIINTSTWQLLETDPQMAALIILNRMTQGPSLVATEKAAVKTVGNPLTIEYLFKNTGVNFEPAHLFALDLGIQLNEFDIPRSSVNGTLSFLDSAGSVIGALTQTFEFEAVRTGDTTRPVARFFPLIPSFSASADATGGALPHAVTQGTEKKWAAYRPYPIQPMAVDGAGAVPAPFPFYAKGISGFQVTIPDGSITDGVTVLAQPITTGHYDILQAMIIGMAGDSVVLDMLNDPTARIARAGA